MADAIFWPIEMSRAAAPASAGAAVPSWPWPSSCSRCGRLLSRNRSWFWPPAEVRPMDGIVKVAEQSASAQAISRCPRHGLYAWVSGAGVPRQELSDPSAAQTSQYRPRNARGRACLECGAHER